MSGDQDPRVSAYINIRWKLLTCWFNMITLMYIPLALYCDWKERRGQWAAKHVAALRQFKDCVMTNILFPVTMFADYMFWRIWHKDASLIAPLGIFDYMPHWAQHSLHTVSMFIMVMDLLLVPRRRPRNMWPGICLMISFIITYMAVCGLCFLRGEVVYTIFVRFDMFKLILLSLMVIIECLFFYLVQWCIVDLVWDPHNKFIMKKVHVNAHRKYIL
ncbi:androgen-dependent TFPI-regulating protein-like [Battus philenor]|uniref:androgen-dependent TFPI-regulating protein-like n=1 Tax=Battus philenor TaxID=42288 RepID=UPI0035D0076C